MSSSNKSGRTVDSSVAGQVASGSVVATSPPTGTISSSSSTAKMTKDEKLIALLKHQIPEVETIFNIHCRIGEGTFSTVFLASLKSHMHIPKSERKFFAIKHLIPTSHPHRVERELKCLTEIGGTDNVVGVDLCIRCCDAVAFVMPFKKHDKFHDYFNRFDARDLQMYMRNLILALRRVHSFGVIHRDVKPSNFLYDRKNKQFLLVDFGLAQPIKRKLARDPTQQSPNASIQSRDMKTSTGTATPISKSNSNSSNTNINPRYPIPNTNSQSTGVTMKRKAAEIEETENTNTTPTTTTTTESAPANKRARLQLSHSHKHNQLYSPSGMVSGMAISRLSSNQMSSMTGRPRPNTTTTELPIQTAGPRSPVNSAHPPSPFKTPLKQSNELDTRKDALRSPRFDSPLATHVKSAVLYSNMKMLANQQSTPNSPIPHRDKINFNNVSTRPAYESPSHRYTADNRRASSGGNVACFCFGKPTICNVCIIKKEIQASRAGTPGYRPPEVLLKYPHQTTAVDIWAIGVIMISIMSGCYPFFRGSDDLSALLEIITVFGDEEVKQTADTMHRRVTYSAKKRPLHLRKLCIRLRNRGDGSTNRSSAAVLSAKSRVKTCDNCQQSPVDCLCAHTIFNSDFSEDIYPESAYDLMRKLLTIDPEKRISANEALEHPFLCADL